MRGRRRLAPLRKGSRMSDEARRKMSESQRRRGARPPRPVSRGRRRRTSSCGRFRPRRWSAAPGGRRPPCTTGGATSGCRTGGRRENGCKSEFRDAEFPATRSQGLTLSRSSSRFPPVAEVLRVHRRLSTACDPSEAHRSSVQPRAGPQTKCPAWQYAWRPFLVPAPQYSVRRPSETHRGTCGSIRPQGGGGNR